MIKYVIKEYRRRRILSDIKKAKRYFQEGMIDFMCLCFMRVSIKYCKYPIDSIIPEFNRDFLNAEYNGLSIWWDRDDRESRIKAFDKLIDTYSKKRRYENTSKN